MGISIPLRRAYAQFCRELEPNHFVTLATNGDGSIAGVRRLAISYCARMDRKLLGHSWHETPAAQRTDGVFFVEHVASNIHLHGLLRFPSRKAEGLAMATSLIWTKLCTAGTSHVADIRSLSPLVDYCMKEARFDPDYSDDQIILVRELMSERSNAPT